MLRQVILGVVSATFVVSAGASEWAFEDAYWQQALSAEKTAVIFAAADSVVRDVPVSDGSMHVSGVTIVESQNATHRALERSGFTQFAD